jgi:hypothetical protein
MECTEIREALSEAALGDLDEAVARRVDAHVEGCAACRGARSSVATVLSALQGAPGMGPSIGRRETVVRAMARARGSRPRRSSWLRWGAAAAVFALAVCALVTFGGERGFDIRVASVAGRVELLERSTGLWRPLGPGDEVHPGDRVVTQAGGIVLLDLGTGSCHLEPESSLDFVSGRRIVLDRGRVAVDLHASRMLVISDTANNTVSLRSGRVEIGLLEAKGRVAGSQETREGVVRMPSAVQISARLLSARMIDGEADLDGSHRQRLRLVAGQEGTFDFGGKPSTHESEKR